MIVVGTPCAGTATGPSPPKWVFRPAHFYNSEVSMADPIRPEVVKQMHQIGSAIGDVLPPGFGFALFVFEMSEEGHMNYISNANREDMVKALLEFLENLKKDSQ